MNRIDFRTLILLLRTMFKGEALPAANMNMSTGMKGGRRSRLRSVFRIGGKERGDVVSAGKSLKHKLMPVVFFLMMLVLYGFYGYSLGRYVPSVDPLIMVILKALPLVIAMFAIPNVVTVLYYSSELPLYLSLPVNEATLVTAKLIQAAIYNVLLFFMMIMPLLFGLGIAREVSWLYYLSLIFTGLLLGITAQAVVSIVLIIVMRFTKFARNKDRFMMVNSILILVFVMVIALLPSFMSGGYSVDEDAGRMGAMQTLEIGRNSKALSIASAIFSPASLFLQRAELWHDGLLPAWAYLAVAGITAGICLVLYLIARRFYLDGAMAAQGGGGKKRGKLSAQRVRKGLASRSTFAALLQKEWIILRRTPSYFMNYLLAACIVPVMMLAPVLIAVITRGLFSIKEIKPLLENLHGTWRTADFALEATRWIYIVAIAVMAFFGSMAVLSSSIVSREGKDAYLMKLMPQSYLLQLRTKLFLGALLGLVATAIFLPAILLSQAPWYTIAVMLLIYFSELYFTQLQGAALDLTFPRLDWAQEIEVAKRATVSFGSLFLALLLGGVKAGSVYLFSEFVTKDPVLVTIFVLVIYLVLHFIAELFIRTYARRKLEALVI